VKLNTEKTEKEAVHSVTREVLWGSTWNNYEQIERAPNRMEWILNCWNMGSYCRNGGFFILWISIGTIMQVPLHGLLRMLNCF